MCRLVALVLLGSFAHLQTPLTARADKPAPVAGDLVITDVTVIDVVAGKARPAQTVVIAGDRIAAIGPAATTRAACGAKVISGTGKYLIPGLWDMHVHLADEAMPGLFLRFGVTGVRHMYSLFSGFPDRAKADPSRGDAPAGPRVLAAATHLLDGNASPFPTNVKKVDTADKARLAVQELQKQKNDFLKVHAALPPEAYFAALKEAKRLNFPVAGHVPYGITAAEASAAGQFTIEHLDGVAVSCSALEPRCRALLREFATAAKPDPHTPWRVELEALGNPDKNKPARVFKMFVDNNTWHVPTLIEAQCKVRLGDKEALDPEIRKLLPGPVLFFWGRKFDDKGGVTVLGRTYTKQDLGGRQQLLEGELKLVGAMHRAGVKLMAGTDTPAPLIVPGLSLHEELELLVRAGLSPAEALRTATTNPADCLKLAARFGTVEVGKCADLVLLAKDPLADIRNTRTIEVVIVGGRPVPRSEPKK
jgi:imidazolonepropionase-like amidohydrolase